METPALTSILAAEEHKILACVHCGLCLEACPTYVVTGDENDSPRGRIYLMRAVDENRLAKTSAAFQRHIDRCLGCRACETVCPAGVEYGQLLEAARAEILSAPVRRGFLYSVMRFVLRHVWLQPSRLRAAFAFSRFVRNQGIAGLLLRTKVARVVSPRLEFALALLNSSGPTFSVQSPRPSHHAESSPPALLFRGCVTDGLFERVNEATVRVLSVNGCAVIVPENQVCCGALHAHAGDLEGARILARQNLEAFGDAETNSDSPVVTNAGGCGAMLASYGHLLADDTDYHERARRFSSRVRDVGQQLEVTGVREGAPIGPSRITYDASCHLLHGQHGGDASLKMLAAVPDLKFVPLEGSDVCCGGAGVYNLLEAELSAHVLEEKLKRIKESGAEILATGNAGCHMQIGAGAHLAGMKLRLCHPVELLDKSYYRAGLYEESEDRGN